MGLRQPQRRVDAAGGAFSCGVTARMSWLAKLSPEIRQYMVVTGNYWAFTLTDGALRMLVVLYFHGLGYSPLEIAMLFLFYEIFGVITNLVGGWLGARLGLNKTMNVGLFLQIVALSLLLVPASLLTVPWVMAAQALSGIAKDLNKMSAKSSIKLLAPADAQGQLYKWIAILTGSKNALKGAGFFFGRCTAKRIRFPWSGIRHGHRVGPGLVVQHAHSEKGFGESQKQTEIQGDFF